MKRIFLLFAAAVMAVGVASAQDINKAIVLRQYRDNQNASDTVREYLAYECNLEGELLDEVQKHTDLSDLLAVYDAVKNTTHCTTGCGGCYDKVIHIISDSLSNK